MTSRDLSYVYIAGLSHSGSTLLAFLLNAHPELVSVGEASRVGDFLPDRWSRRHDLCSCGKAFYHCEFWNRTLAGLAARGFGLNAHDPFDHPAGERARSQEMWPAFVESCLDVSGAKVFVDASKVVRYLSQLADHPRFDLKVLNLIRDGRGVIHSWQKYLSDTSRENIIDAWVQREKARAAALAAIDAGRIITVKYEDLCTDPASSLQTIFRFIGVDPAVEAATGFKSQVEHHVIGNQMRLTGEEEIRLDEKWRQALSPETRNLFIELAGDINRRNGYVD